MGMTDKDAERQAARNAPPVEKPAVAVTREDATLGNERLLRGIPVDGIGGGAITGTRPGDSSHELQRTNAELHATMMARARTNLKGQT